MLNICVFAGCFSLLSIVTTLCCHNSISGNDLTKNKSSDSVCILNNAPNQFVLNEWPKHFILTRSMKVKLFLLLCNHIIYCVCVCVCVQRHNNRKTFLKYCLAFPLNFLRYLNAFTRTYKRESTHLYLTKPTTSFNSIWRRPWRFPFRLLFK